MVERKREHRSGVAIGSRELPVVRERHFSADRQAETRTGIAPMRAAPEANEELVEVLGSDAGAFIAHCDARRGDVDRDDCILR